MSSPSISVTNCGSAFSTASHLCQSYPVAQYPCEFLDHCQRHALRPVGDGLLLRPIRGVNAMAQVVQRVLRNVDVEGTDLDCGLNAGTHADLLPP